MSIRMRGIMMMVVATWVTALAGSRAVAQDGAVEAPLTPEASFFFDALTPYGEWAWEAPNGWIWIPRAMPAGWRPYTDGHWVYTECGWTWSSDLEWGWAPFHYGRWFFHEHRGWCWVPGSVWGPAWVTWHWGDEYCGWAPIPPGVAWETCSDWDAVVPSFGWCFVEHRAFRERHLQSHVVLVARNVTLLHVTRNVTRFERRNEGIINLSVTAEQVEHVSGRPVRRFQIGEAHSQGELRTGPRVAGRMNFYRPTVRETRVVTPVPHGRAGGTPPAVTFDQLRRQEATHREWQAQQARERAALEKQHEAELRRPPPSVSPPELLERHQAEHRAFNEHLNRQNQVLEHRPGPPPGRGPGR